MKPSVPTIQTVLRLLPKKTLIKILKRARTKTKAILVFISIYPFKFFKLSIVIEPKFLK
jgi:hypothetical protein